MAVFWLHVFLIIIFMLTNTIAVPLFQPSVILSACESSCLVLFPGEALSTETESLLSVLADVSFSSEPSVVFGSVEKVPFSWPNGKPLQVQGSPHAEDLARSILLFKQLKKDRTCLLVPDDTFIAPLAVHHKLPTDSVIDEELDNLISSIVEFININCGTFRSRDGSLNIAGIHRKDILENLFTTSSPRISLKKCQKLNDGEENHIICAKNIDSKRYEPHPSSVIEQYLSDEDSPPQECEKIEAPSAADFFHDYLSRSRPVIITGATEHWAAFQKWSNEFLRENFGDRTVHIKITSDGEYEGVESVSLWESHKEFKIPQPVREKLPYPDLVVVRPASMEILFSDFLDLIENISAGRVTNMSAYLEYSSIRDYFPNLREDISEMQFFKNVLDLKHLNIWLSDGNTLGKLHFDPFDNFLCQISGEKQVLMYEPHDNTRLYEGHIQEAILSYNTTEKAFHRKKLLDSTSMVMSPVDPLKPDLQRFPKFSEVRPLNCTIRAGEVLFMPSFWWHEVQSRPNTSEHRNLAINFWYEPFLTREFPCPECELDVNPKYFHLL